MVVRKPVPNPPYPVTPTTPVPPAIISSSTVGTEISSSNIHASSAAPPSTLDTVKELRQQSQLENDESSAESDDEWDTDGFEDIDDDVPKPRQKEEIPAQLKAGVSHGLSGNVKPGEALPATLRVGPPDGALRRSPDPQQKHDITPASNDSAQSSSTSIPLQSHNPFLKLQHSGQQPIYGTENSSAVWGDSRLQSNPFISNTPPVELPAEKSPVEGVSSLSLLGAVSAQTSAPDPGSPNSKQPPLIPVSPEEPPKLKRYDSDLVSPFNPGMDVTSLDAFSSRNHRLPPIQSEDQVHRTWQEQQAWERSERERRERELAAVHEAARLAEEERRAEEEWHRGEEAAAAALQQNVGRQELPPLPPRKSTEEQPPSNQPPKPPHISTSQGAAAGPSEVETPSTRAERQRKEHYQIKHIRWFDPQKQGIRQAPILVQNVNGPCPLLALVNALVLSTSTSEDTALIETLRTREQVTLGLLLDAVFDELMSGRRGGAAQELPDVGELYTFLVTLHTGMNINPRFVKPLDDPGNRNSGNFHPAVRGQAQLGGFENTREMKLYGTFDIPLVHGWLPPGESRAYAAFNRRAKTYEDAHVLQFQEEELDAKLQSHGLDAEEQHLFEDIHTIKEFFDRWPTQLTDFGLQVMANNLEPGQIAILFRNDHFSTLYKEPRSGQILTLVTDAGYSRHEEIVWESLVDVNGQGSELYSGDFRPVGNMSEAAANGRQNTSSQERPIRSLLDADDDQEWTTVEGRNRRNRPNQAPTPTPGARPDPALMPDPLASPTNDSHRIEQEDHDLALALQLQEEEEDRHRREVAERRRRENELNEQFLSAEQQRTGPRNPPLIPPRRNRPSTSSTTTPVPATGGNANEDDAPPPTYEQAAGGRPYHPPPGHPANPNAPIRPTAQTQSAYGQMSNQTQTSLPINQGRRRPGRQTSGVTGPLIDQIPPSSGRMNNGRRPSASIPTATKPEDKCIVM